MFGYPVNFFTYLAHLLPKNRSLLLLSDPNFDAFLVCLLPVTISLLFESLRGKNTPILVDVWRQALPRRPMVPCYGRVCWVGIWSTTWRESSTRPRSAATCWLGCCIAPLLSRISPLLFSLLLYLFLDDWQLRFLLRSQSLFGLLPLSNHFLLPVWRISCATNLLDQYLCSLNLLLNYQRYRSHIILIECKDWELRQCFVIQEGFGLLETLAISLDKLPEYIPCDRLT